VALNIFSVIIAVYFHTHKNVYQCTCMEQKTTAVCRDVGLQYRMWVRSPSGAWISEVVPSFWKLGRSLVKTL